MTDEELKQKIHDITQTMLEALSEWQAGAVVSYTSIKEKGRQDLFDLIKPVDNHLEEDLKQVSTREKGSLNSILKELVNDIDDDPMFMTNGAYIEKAEKDIQSYIDANYVAKKDAFVYFDTGKSKTVMPEGSTLMSNVGQSNGYRGDALETQKHAEMINKEKE